MADAGSALESQQSIAAKIPYENIDANQKGLGLALGAFFHAAEVSKQRQQLENALLGTQMKLAETSRWHDIEMKNMELGTAIKLQGMDLRERSMEDRLDLGARKLDLVERAQNLKSMLESNKAESTAGLMDSFKNLDPGSEDFQKNYFAALASNSTGAETPIGRLAAKQLGDIHNKGISRQFDKYNADMREFGLEVNNRVWRGEMSPNKVDLSPLVHPEMWKDQYVNKKTGEKAGPEMAGKPGWDTSGSKFLGIPLVDPNTGLAKKDANGQTVYKEYSTMSIPELNGMRKRYQDLLKRKGEIPQQIVTDDVKPVVAGTATNPYPPLPQDKAQRAAGTVYTAPGGTFLWDGSGLIRQ